MLLSPFNMIDVNPESVLEMNENKLSPPCFPLVSLLKDLKHANIVTLHDIVHTDKSLTLVFEYLVRPREILPSHQMLSTDAKTHTFTYLLLMTICIIEG